MSEILTNARLVLEDKIVLGTIVIKDGRISEIDTGKARNGSAIDFEGDYLTPGFIEMHTDNLERHFVPRPEVFWPNPLAAALAHDREMLAAGVTTVYDAIAIGAVEGRESVRAKARAAMLDAIQAGVDSALFRLDHKLHLRCEVSDEGLMSTIEPLRKERLVKLVSVMDHTPGQRQWHDLELLKTFSRRSGKSDAEIDASIQARIEKGNRCAEDNRAAVLNLWRDTGIPLASHDDATAAHVDQAAAEGIVIAEFPTTIEAAKRAHEQGMVNIGGAPNAVRRKSHSGNVSVLDLAAGRLLDGLSSDYVPASLAQAAFTIADNHDIDLQDCIATMTWRMADVLGLNDRGRLQPGLRADLTRLRRHGDTPIVEAVYVGGARAF